MQIHGSENPPKDVSVVTMHAILLPWRPPLHRRERLAARLAGPFLTVAVSRALGGAGDALWSPGTGRARRLETATRWWGSQGLLREIVL